MRRYAFLILFVIVLVTPFILRKVIGGDPGGAHRSAPPGRRLIVMTPHGDPIRQEFQEGFSAWLKERGEPDVLLDYRNFGGGASDIVKYFDSSKELFAKTGRYGVDLVWGGGDDLFNRQFKKPGYLDKVELSPAIMRGAYPEDNIFGVPLYDPDRYWYGTALSSFGIVYNKDICRYLKVPEPKTWADLADPRYQGWIVLADPTRSSSAKTAFMTIVEKAIADAVARGDSQARGWQDGMALIRLIASNTRAFADASSSVPNIVASGDVAAGMAIDFYGRTQVEFVGESRMGYVEPKGATIINPDPIAIVKGAEHRALAVQFIEFVLSEQGQRIWNYRVGTEGGPRANALRRLPIRRSTYEEPAYAKYAADPGVNPFRDAGGFNTRAQRRETFPILGEIIQVSSMDLLEELREARAAILASPKSAELSAKLAKFPFDEREAVARQKAFAGAPPLKKLEMLRQWTQEFKAEYEGYRREAK